MSKRGIKLEETKGKRLNDLDVLKVICAFLVICIHIADKLNIRKKMYFLIPVLLITNIIFGEYAIALFNKDYDPIYMRNFLFIGLPYFLIGDLLYKNKENLIKKFSIKS